MTFGEKLQELLDWRGKSQSKVAELAEVSQSAISDYVNGRSTPSIDAARRIAKALDVSLWTLLNGEALAVVSMDLTERERRLVSGYRRLNDEQRAAVAADQPALPLGQVHGGNGQGFAVEQCPEGDVQRICDFLSCVYRNLSVAVDISIEGAF